MNYKFNEKKSSKNKTLLNIYATNIRAPKLIKEIQLQLKTHIDSQTIMVTLRHQVRQYNSSYTEKFWS